jgi:cysteinyl-tRNA synthetase
MATTSTSTTVDPLDPASADDWFDIDKYRQAAGVAYEFSKKKIEDTAREQRETIGKQATEERAGASQKQEFSQADEARDYAQARGAYKY